MHFTSTRHHHVAFISASSPASLQRRSLAAPASKCFIPRVPSPCSHRPRRHYRALVIRLSVGGSGGSGGSGSGSGGTTPTNNGVDAECDETPTTTSTTNSSDSTTVPISDGSNEDSGGALQATSEVVEGETGEVAKSNADEAAHEERVKKQIDRVLAFIRRLFQPPAFIVGLLSGVVITVLLIFVPSQGGSGDQAVLRQKVTLFDVILQDISRSYVEQVDVNKLFETGVNSMLSTLDPYTQFENNNQAFEMSVKTNGRYAGVGLGLSLSDDDEDNNGKDDTAANKPIIVVSAFEGYAFDVGVRPGDVIHAVEGSSVRGKSLEDVTDMLRGSPGTQVSIDVLRKGSENPLHFVLSRKNVQLRDVPAYTLLNGGRTMYVKLQSFAKDAYNEVLHAVTALQAQSNGSVTSLVLDLRGNPGGLLNSAIEVSELFVPKDSTIVSTYGRGLASNTPPDYVSSKTPVLDTTASSTPALKLAVLVNGQTASASEIVAGAVQDLDLGIVVGSRTFGKGLIQNVQELPFNTALKYTVGKYYTPSGRCIQSAGTADEAPRTFHTARFGRPVRNNSGIEPDVEVSKKLSFLQLSLLKQNMYFRFANDFAARAGTTEEDVDMDRFRVTTDIYKDFVKYVNASKSFAFQSKFDEMFDELQHMLSDVGYTATTYKVGELKRATHHEMKADFLKYEHDIKAQLESAIRFRFQPDSKRIVADLHNDEQLLKTIDILNDDAAYNAILSEDSPGAIGAAYNNGAQPGRAEQAVDAAGSNSSTSIDKDNGNSDRRTNADNDSDSNSDSGSSSQGGKDVDEDEDESTTRGEASEEVEVQQRSSSPGSDVAVKNRIQRVRCVASDEDDGR